MSLAITISFHGGSGKNNLNNLHTYPGDTKILDTKGVTLDELRGFTLGPGGNLYVVVGHKGSDSNVLSFTPPAKGSNQYTNGQAFVSPQNSLSHPFALVFAGSNLFVSNQDTNKITQYDAKTGKYVGDFADGFNELRGLTASSKHLYAADEKGGKNKTGQVSWYDLPSGGSQKKASPAGQVDVTDPVHIVHDGKHCLYIGSEKQNAVYCYDTHSATGPQQLTLPSGGPTIDATGGLAIVSDGGTTYLLVASRLGMQVNQYTLDISTTPPTLSSGVVFAGSLTDNPEFVSALGVSGAVSG